MQGSSYAPLQFLRSPWNRDVYTAIDNQIDGRTVLVLYLGAASTLPSELQKYNVGCILIHKDEKQIYLNIGSDTTPTWQSFGPGTNTLPTPFLSGYVLTNDGVDAFWSLVDLATMVTGLLDSDHIDLSDLANNSDFIDFLIANSYFTTSLANDTNFINTLTSNVNFQNAVNTFVSGSGVLQIDQTPDNGTFGLLAGDVDGVNDTYTVSLGAYAAGKLQVYLNGLIQLQGASDDYIELVPGSGTFQFNTPPATNDIITVVYSGSASVVDNYTVKATVADTTPSFLDSKIELVSGTNTTVTKTILNPGANEKIRYQVNSTGGYGSLVTPGGEYYIGNDEPSFIVSFDKYIVNSSSQLEAYYIDSNGSYNRAVIPSSTPPIGWSTPSTLSPTVSEDGQFLYITKSYTVSFGVFGLTVDKLDVNMNIVSTYTSTTYSPTIVSIQPMTFVKGNNIVICANATQPYSVGNPIYAEEFLMSGSTLTQTGITNIQYGVFGGGFFNFPRNGFTAIDGFTYLQYEFSGAEQVFKNTYSALTLTNIGTSVFNTNNTGIETVYSWYTGSKTYFGFTIDGTNIGWFRKTFTLDQMSSPPFTQFFIWKYIYQLYPF